MPIAEYWDAERIYIWLRRQVNCGLIIEEKNVEFLRPHREQLPINVLLTLLCYLRVPFKIEIKAKRR